ncbi:hypothetical protein PA598K_04952 [Paenibacillus sp. 598K]|uniref:YutD-like domain-containing protein n=1 Tax=Paenibacillus sp. 598K TaxID=1117987 RepID=UPI000FF98994|nr:YutD-like domain-containing protein [Paenibacillus sp. 598K]GBF76478.1 hypothetical protein PA598K_04952 [Paenibacillus sp. 598K]
MIHIGGRTFELVHEYKTAWNAEAFRNRYSDVLERYDYIIGDWGYGQLRLKGFYRDSHPKATKDTSFTFMSDYISEYCNFGCPYFVLLKTGTAKKNDPGKEGGDSDESELIELSEPGLSERHAPPAAVIAAVSEPVAATGGQGAPQGQGGSGPRQRPYKSRNRGSRSSGKPRNAEGKGHEGRASESRGHEGGRAHEAKGQEAKGQEGRPADGKRQEGRTQEGRGQEGRSQEGRAQEGKPASAHPAGARQGEGRSGGQGGGHQGGARNQDHKSGGAMTAGSARSEGRSGHEGRPGQQSQQSGGKPQEPKPREARGGADKPQEDKKRDGQAQEARTGQSRT